jgi:predicted 2-oxoglutarate/Fe(II)-dependent dioxygenase YbiX/alkylated DNA repair dioxygenase AlkB
MSAFTSKFTSNRYVYIPNLINADYCSKLTDILKRDTKQYGWADNQCPKSLSIRDNATFDKLLVDILPLMEDHSGKKLLPTYAYARLYAPGEILKIHRDRPSCEISASVTIGFSGNVWPFYIGNNADGTDGLSIRMNVGDAILYKGEEMYHWRNEYVEGTWQAQVFLHYVDANGPNKEWKFDKRDKLAFEPTKEDKDLTYWRYDDILSADDCDQIIATYTALPGEVATVGDGPDRTVVKTIRNANKTVLPAYKGIGAKLAAVGLNANSQRWKFDITHANQTEFLKYPAGGGRYKGHVDTFMEKDYPECRKLTVLAFLNDNFTGGKFYLQTTHDRFYPPQTKGTVLVFPSFILHGVEDVTEGDRYSAVTWMVGPWFK